MLRRNAEITNCDSASFQEKKMNFQEVFVNWYNNNLLRLCFQSVTYCLMIEGSRSESGYEPVTCGSGKAKNLRIRNTVFVTRPKLLQRREKSFLYAVLRIRDPVPFWSLDPGSGIGFFRIPNPYFWQLTDNFLGKMFKNSLKIDPNFFLQLF
jgi:hypothetical protein